MLIPIGFHLSTLARAADCEGGPTARAAIAVAADRVESAWVQLDLGGLREGEGELRRAVLCVTERLTTADAARFWRAEALAFYVAEDMDRARSAYCSARHAHADYVLPEALVPSGHPLRAAWAEAAACEAGPPPSMPLPKARGSWYEISGRRATDAPADRSYIVQSFRDGALEETLILDAGALPPPPPGPCALSPKRCGAAKGFLRAGVAEGLGAVALGGVALALNHVVRTAPHTQALEQAHGRWTAAAVGAGGVAGAATLTIGIGIALVPRRHAEPGR